MQEKLHFYMFVARFTSGCICWMHFCIVGYICYGCTCFCDSWSACANTAYCQTSTEFHKCWQAHFYVWMMVRQNNCEDNDFDIALSINTGYCDTKTIHVLYLTHGWLLFYGRHSFAYCWSITKCIRHINASDNMPNCWM